MTQHLDALDIAAISLCCLVIAAAVLTCICDWHSSRNRRHNLPPPARDSRDWLRQDREATGERFPRSS